VVGVTTASLIDAQVIAESHYPDTHIGLFADRLVTLYRPELQVGPVPVKPADRDVVCLSGSSPQWDDTRCSRLRFDPQRLGFSTVL
jgi:hypothetical protein